MNPLFKNLYKHKKTRVRDPNLPPPPNLFSTVRDLKLTKADVDTTVEQLKRVVQRVEALESKNRYLTTYVERLTQHLTKK